MIDLTAFNSDIGIAKHTACRDAMMRWLASFLVLGRTTAATVHVAVPFVGCRGANACRNRCGLLNSDMRIALHVAVGRAAIHAVHDGTAIDSDISVTGISQIDSLMQKAKCLA